MAAGIIQSILCRFSSLSVLLTVLSDVTMLVLDLKALHSPASTTGLASNITTPPPHTHTANSLPEYYPRIHFPVIVYAHKYLHLHEVNTCVLRAQYFPIFIHKHTRAYNVYLQWTSTYTLLPFKRPLNTSPLSNTKHSHICVHLSSYTHCDLHTHTFTHIPTCTHMYLYTYYPAHTHY